LDACSSNLSPGLRRLPESAFSLKIVRRFRKHDCVSALLLNLCIIHLADG
jgi:hypothetical protein